MHINNACRNANQLRNSCVLLHARSYDLSSPETGLCYLVV